MRTAPPPAPASGPGGGRARDAGAPSDAPDIDAPAGRDSAPVPEYKRSADESPACTVYENASEAVPEPDAYTAAAAPPRRPTSSASSGAPAASTARENLTAISTDEPAGYEPAAAETDATSGGGCGIASPTEARTMRTGSSGEDGTAYTSGPAWPRAGAASARDAMPPLPLPPSTGTAAISLSRCASYTRTAPPEAAYSIPVPPSSARSRGSPTAVSTWYRNDGTGVPCAPDPKPGASEYAASEPFSYSTYSFDRAASTDMPAAVYDELSAARSGRRAASMLETRA